jgi:hypothetical protein
MPIKVKIHNELAWTKHMEDVLHIIFLLQVQQK